MITSVQQALKTVDEIRNFLVGLLMSEEQLGYLKDLLNREDWPPAVAEIYICDSEEDKIDRAESILDFVITGSIKDKKFLDFGCGLGHIAVKAHEFGAKVAVGYDVVPSSSFEWEKDNGYLLTTDLMRLTSLSPFDFIILYDVLDHAINPVETLQQVRDLCHPNTEVFVRCHPFYSRHGGHLYKQFNKAFLHKIFTQKELLDMGYSFEGYMQRLEQPIICYHQWFNKSDFQIIREDSVQDDIEGFFDTNALLAARMAIKPSVIGLWKHNVNGVTQNIAIYPNGKFKNLQGHEIWELDGLKLKLRWPVSGGTWVDDLTLNSDMTHYEGKNQQGIIITGDKIDSLKQSFFDFVLKPC